MTLRRYSAWLALGFGPVLLLQSALRHWQHWSGWITADVAAAMLLALGGGMVLRDESDLTARWLSGGWGFAAATLWISFFTLIPDWSDAGDPREGQAVWVVVAGWMAITALTGFAGALAGNQNARR